MKNKKTGTRGVGFFVGSSWRLPVVARMRFPFVLDLRRLDPPSLAAQQPCWAFPVPAAGPALPPPTARPPCGHGGTRGGTARVQAANDLITFSFRLGSRRAFP
jgi:hypothetical protein